MKIYNTLKKKIEEFEPLEKGKVKIYFCGMTVQDSPHLGHLRAFIAADILVRYLEYKGYNVKYVMNITDIDDKIIAKAIKEGKDFREISARYEREFFDIVDMINLRKADIYPRATQHIQEICEGIKKLLEKGLAYESEGNIWYDVSEFEEYGKLSGKSLEELEEGARIEPDPSKRDPLDFSLWKKKKEKEPFFYSPFSEGRPGWHIECSAMSMKHLGETIDIHGGGEDLIFPHHENEIAQSEGITGKEFAKYWFHVGLVRMKGEKMSKSTGLFFKAKKALERYSPNVLRYFLLRAHYRSPLEYSEDIMETSKKSWERIENFINLEEQKEISTFSERAKNYLKKFEEYMENDLNTPKVFALLYELVSLGNRLYQESNEEFFEIKAVIELILQIMGFKREERKIDFQEELLSLIIEIRQKLREEKNFKLSDKIREKLKSLGIVVEDTKDKPRIKFLK